MNERERELSDERSGRVCVCVCLLSQGGNKAPKTVALASDSPRFRPFFPFRPPFGRLVPLMPSLFSRSRTTSSPLRSQKPSTELSDEFGRVSSRNSTRGAVTVPVKKDKNVEKTRTRTLSGVKGRAPGPVVNEEEVVIPDGSFFPLNLDPHGGEPASPSDAERGPYLLHLPSLVIFPPSSSSSLFVEALGAISRSFGDRQCCARAWRHHRVSLVCPHRASCFRLDPRPWIPLLTMNIPGHRQREQEYGCLSYFHHIVLGLDEVDRLVHTVTEELGTRGLKSPFLFSSLALDANSSGVRRLIQAFLRTCVSFPAPDAERTWHDEARFAAPAELAMCLRWGLARVLRVSGGHAVRGLLSWDMYVEWSEAELGKRLSPPVFIYTMLTPVSSPRLSSNPF
jgi:Domain of unknown function (DUF1708)